MKKEGIFVVQGRMVRNAMEGSGRMEEWKE